MSDRLTGLLATLADEVASPPPEPSASILELTAVRREALEDIESHRRMTATMNSDGHRQHALAVIISRMTYLEMLDFAESLLDGQTSLEAASLPGQLARWAKRVKDNA